MRKGASGWLAKGLLLLLVASFGVWGIGGDMLSSSVGSNVIEVGDTSVSLGEFQRDYQRNLNILSARFNTQLTQEQAQQFGLAQMTVNQIASRALINEKTRSLGLSADDDAVRKMIQSQPSFQNQFQQFDRFMFEQFLARNGYSEGEYIEIVRNDITGNQLFGTLSQGVTKAPSVLVDTFYAYLAEKRTARYIDTLDSSIGFAPAPTDEELEELIDENPDDYSAPEYRKVSYILLTPETLAAGTDISDEDLKAEYEARKSEFDTPETRAVVQMIFKNEDKAAAAYKKITEGTDFAEVAMSDLQLTPADIDLGMMSKTDLLPELQESVFDLQKGGVTEPVKTVLGWHVAKVEDIVPGEERDFDAVKDQLKADILQNRAQELLYAEATKLEDEFAGGAKLQEAAATLDLPVVTTNWIDASGSDKTGNAVTDLPTATGFLSEAFARQVGDDAEVSETADGGYYAVVVDEIETAAVKPLADVKEQVTQDWQANWRHEEARKKAEELLAKLNTGESLETIATDLGLTVQTSTAVLRSGSAEELSPVARDGLFDLEPGAYGVNVNQAGNGTLLYGIADIIPADPATDKDAFTQMSDQIAASMRTGILAEYENYLQKDIGISVKEDLIKEYF
ncbi:SurA N-terminal domain-containing protein [Sneathiella sp.]|uniref:SurA N-terminal domain-containing protein n=1 Tax=Sneathiella sp. TaxID=1964365 RepID=UPI00260FA351|nr:SurA N-terminal domain-containing protein [Sneathiella sp.]MDF2369110.1 SurA N-terminal domain-containing protein [Sneathiella sp.]